MKKMIFRSTFLMMSILGFALLFSACQQDSLTEDIQLEMVQDADDALSLRCPTNISANVERGRCCRYRKRNAEITLNATTYVNYCGGICGDELTYKFYRYDNPSAPPIVRVSDEPAPRFCLPQKDYAMLISHNGVPELMYNSGFYLPNNPGGAASPIYYVDLRGNCYSTPVPPPRD